MPALLRLRIHSPFRSRTVPHNNVAIGIVPRLLRSCFILHPPLPSPLHRRPPGPTHPRSELRRREDQRCRRCEMPDTQMMQPETTIRAERMAIGTPSPRSRARNAMESQAKQKDHQTRPRKRPRSEKRARKRLAEICLCRIYTVYDAYSRINNASDGMFERDAVMDMDAANEVPHGLRQDRGKGCVDGWEWPPWIAPASCYTGRESINCAHDVHGIADGNFAWIEPGS